MPQRPTSRSRPAWRRLLSGVSAVGALLRLLLPVRKRRERDDREREMPATAVVVEPAARVPEELTDEVETLAGLAALGSLTQRHRARGMRVAVTISGPRRPLTPAIDLASYRIVEEALANAGRHRRDRAIVDIRFGEDGLEITVTNPAWERGETDDALAIVGIRERVTLLGGSLHAGPDDGHFRVYARLPYEDAFA